MQSLVLTALYAGLFGALAHTVVTDAKRMVIRSSTCLVIAGIALARMVAAPELLAWETFAVAAAAYLLFEALYNLGVKIGGGDLKLVLALLLWFGWPASATMPSVLGPGVPDFLAFMTVVFLFSGALAVTHKFVLHPIVNDPQDGWQRLFPVPGLPVAGRAMARMLPYVANGGGKIAYGLAIAPAAMFLAYHDGVARGVLPSLANLVPVFG